MKIQSIKAEVKPGDPGPGDVHSDFAEVTVDLGEREVTFIIHQSKVHPDAINVEIDGDLVAGDPSLRIHLNDNLILDSKHNPVAVDDEREDEDEDED